MTAATLYGTSTVKRVRSTKPEIELLQFVIVEIVTADAPMTVRGVYYQTLGRMLVDKSDDGYRKVQRQVLQLRRSGQVRYQDITDGTRWVIHPPSHSSVEDALFETARTYRRSLWGHSDLRIQVFTEKDAISGVLAPVCKKWDVPLGIQRGYSSESFAWQVAMSLNPRRRNLLVQFGDHDPSGVGAWQNFIDKVKSLTDIDTDLIEPMRLAVTPEQIVQYNLPLRPTKIGDTRARGWQGGSVEVDAIPARELRRLLEEFIVQHVDPHQLGVLFAAEESERELLHRMARSVLPAHWGTTIEDGAQ